MLHKLRRRAEDEKGFTLIELLVVILIIGILAAIAIPAFLNQRGKAYDATAKSQVRTMQTAEETYATDHDGTYTALLADLTSIEPTLSDSGTATPTVNTPPAGSSYQVVSTANKTGDAFTITSSTGGVVTRHCTAGSSNGAPGGCPSTGSW
jgi:type IV pilus assembly protein PilA